MNLPDAVALTLELPARHGRSLPNRRSVDGGLAKPNRVSSSTINKESRYA